MDIETIATRAFRAFKRQYKMNRIQDIDQVHNDPYLPRMRICGGQDSVCKTKLYAPMVIYQGAHRPAMCMWRSKFRTNMILLQNCAGRIHTHSWNCRRSAQKI
jgi:hypothetical protein